MNGHITPKQAKQVSEKAFYSFFDEIVKRDDWSNYHHKKMNVAKMIEILDQVTIRKNAIDGNWKLIVFEKEYESKELVDVLWEAVKDSVAQ